MLANRDPAGPHGDGGARDERTGNVTVLDEMVLGDADFVVPHCFDRADLVQLALKEIVVVFALGFEVTQGVGDAELDVRRRHGSVARGLGHRTCPGRARPGTRTRPTARCRL